MNAGKQAVLFEQAPAGQTIPFGKYKDQPVEILLTDPDYVTWLRATMGEKLKNQYPLDNILEDLIGRRVEQRTAFKQWHDVTLG